MMVFAFQVESGRPYLRMWLEPGLVWVSESHRLSAGRYPEYFRLSTE